MNGIERSLPLEFKLSMYTSKSVLIIFIYHYLDTILNLAVF